MLNKQLTLKKKVCFSIIALAIFLLVLELFSYAVLSFLCVPMPRNIGGDAYMAADPDLGWIVVPGVSHRIVRYPRGFDITIRTGNGYRKDDQNIRSIRGCDIITIGDSHTFGFGLKEDQTLAYQLHRLLSNNQHKCRVFNGGVPGYGACQYYLRLKSLGQLDPGSLVIVYFNSINDLRGLSRSVDYSQTKPYACLDGHRVKYIKAILYDAKSPIYFAPDFNSLNQAFGLSSPAVPPTTTGLFQKIQVCKLIKVLCSKKYRLRWSQIEPTEDIGSYREGWEQELMDLQYARRKCNEFMASQWSEILEFESERGVAEEILFGIFSDMKKHVEKYHANLLIVISQEAYGNQGFCLRERKVLTEQLPQYTIQDGQARQLVRRAAQRANIPYLMIQYPVDRMESMFIPYDGHTSAEGFSWTANRIVEWIEEKQFAFFNGKRQEEVAVHENANIDKLDGNGYAFLHYAVQNSNKQAVESIINEGVDIDLKDRWGETPLFISASRGYKDILQMLLSNGAGINIADHRGQTPLHQAIHNGQNNTARLLIEEGADIYLENNDGQTPLEVAVRQDQKDIVKLLLSKGATVSSIHVAAQMGDLASIKALLEDGAVVNAQDDKGLTPLHYAVQEGHKELAEFLIDNDGDVNSKDKHGYTPLYYAIWGGKKDVVKLLLAKGADVNTKPEEDYTTLYYAVWMADLDAVKLLVGKGAKFDVKVLDDWNVFRYAAWQGSKEMVEFFISKGAEISQFHIAAFMGDLSDVKELIKNGTKVDEKDEAGWTALFWATCAGQTEVAEYLIDNGADINANDGRGRNTLYQAIQANAISLIELLISNGANVNVKDKRGNRPLHMACQRGNKKVVELLIDKGADLNSCAVNGQTPLHLSVRQGHKDIVELLINKRADVNAKNKWNRTPLNIAIDRDYTEIVELLRRHGAKE